MTYTGRFAPSPTGPLHAGSLVAALASYLHARQADGAWGVRIDDIDPPREVPGASEDILASLKRHGMVPDFLDYQSTHVAAYEDALSALASEHLLFRCQCSRATLASGSICVRDCQTRDIAPETPCSIRIAVPETARLEFEDLFLGHQSYALGKQVRNFILKRKDGLYAYQLAAAVDDGDTRITHALRGADLLDSTPRQLFVQQCLGLTPPAYGHVPVVFDDRGFKLSKQNGAPGLDADTPMQNLMRALQFLGIEKPPGTEAIEELLVWASQHWDRQRIPK